MLELFVAFWKREIYSSTRFGMIIGSMHIDKVKFRFSGRLGIGATHAFSNGLGEKSSVRF